MVLLWSVSASVLLYIDYSLNIKTTPSAAFIGFFDTLDRPTVINETARNIGALLGMATDPSNNISNTDTAYANLTSSQTTADGILTFLSINNITSTSIIYIHILAVYYNVLVCMLVVYRYSGLVIRLRTDYLSSTSSTDAMTDRRWMMVRKSGVQVEELDGSSGLLTFQAGQQSRPAVLRTILN